MIETSVWQDWIVMECAAIEYKNIFFDLVYKKSQGLFNR